MSRATTLLLVLIVLFTISMIASSVSSAKPTTTPHIKESGKIAMPVSEH